MNKLIYYGHLEFKPKQYFLFDYNAENEKEEEQQRNKIYKLFKKEKRLAKHLHNIRYLTQHGL